MRGLLWTTATAILFLASCPGGQTPMPTVDVNETGRPIEYIHCDLDVYEAEYETWIDHNGNGIRDPEDAPLKGVEIRPSFVPVLGLYESCGNFFHLCPQGGAHYGSGPTADGIYQFPPERQFWGVTDESGRYRFGYDDAERLTDLKVVPPPGYEETERSREGWSAWSIGFASVE